MAVAIRGRDVIVTYTAGRLIKVRPFAAAVALTGPHYFGPHCGPGRTRSTRDAHGPRCGSPGARQDGGEEASEPYVVRAALQAPRAARFGPTQVTSAGEAERFSACRVACTSR